MAVFRREMVDVDESVGKFDLDPLDDFGLVDVLLRGEIARLGMSDQPGVNLKYVLP